MKIAACVLTTAGIIIRAFHLSLTGTTTAAPAVWNACGTTARVPMEDKIYFNVHNGKFAQE